MADNTLSQTLEQLKTTVGGGVDPGVMTLLEQIVTLLQSGITIDATNLNLENLPTEDPQEAGVLWLDSNVLTRSAGGA